jgi:L,D-transpeptidase-like protein
MASTPRWKTRRASVVAGGALLMSVATGGWLAAPAMAAPDPAAAPIIAGTPCTGAARACVDLASQRAWLIKDSKVVRGPVKISSGGRGKQTPTGNTFRVYRKDQDHKSTESLIQSGPKKGQPAPMPWSVFFADGGIAFHSGSPAVASAGCIHLNPADAQAFYNFLQIGDHVQVKNGPGGANPASNKPQDTRPNVPTDPTANSAPDDDDGGDSDDQSDDRDHGDHDSDDDGDHGDDD